jgi:hypothetical protein
MRINTMTRRRLRCAVPFILSLVLVQASGAQGRISTIDSLFMNLPHAEFQWVGKAGVSERAAMIVPVELDGISGWFQLDTGLDVSEISAGDGVVARWDLFDGQYHVQDVRIGGMRLGPAWIHGSREPAQDSDIIGSLGLDLLVGRVLLIDYPQHRLTITTPGELPLQVLQRTSWTPAELRDAKLFLTVTLGRSCVTGLFFDTGASAFAVTVGYRKWLELTGATGPESATTRWNVSSWGTPMTALGAPVEGSLIIGSARIEHPLVFFLQEKPELFAEWPFPATGLVGNAPFWDRVVLVDLGLRPRFGLLEP